MTSPSPIDARVACAECNGTGRTPKYDNCHACSGTGVASDRQCALRALESMLPPKAACDAARADPNMSMMLLHPQYQEDAIKPAIREVKKAWKRRDEALKR